MSSPSHPASRPPNSLHIIRALRTHVALPCARCQVTRRYRWPHTPILRRLRPRLHHAPASRESTSASPPSDLPPLRIPRDVYDWRVAGMHDKDQDVSAKNTASNAANVVAHSHAADEDRPTADKTQTSICPPRLAVPFHAWTRIAPPYARIGTMSSYAWTSTIPCPPLRDIFLSSSRVCLCAFNKPCETSSASTSAYSPLRVRVLPSSSTATSFLPPGSASATRLTRPSVTSSASSCAPTPLARTQAPRPLKLKEGLGQRPARDKQRFLLRLERILSLQRTQPQRGQRPQIQRHRQRIPHLPQPVRRNARPLQAVMGMDVDGEGKTRIAGGYWEKLRLRGLGQGLRELGSRPCAARLGMYGDDAAIPAVSISFPFSNARYLLASPTRLGSALAHAPITQRAALPPPTLGAVPNTRTCTKRPFADPPVPQTFFVVPRTQPTTSATQALSSPFLQARF
ncbi:hypothetical protein C8R44DRAFT_895746 [Mycena epipterygia]|nr:hypothetical protein C8R44DRAFT_895746 [Mycena epipterygia]